VLDPFTVIVAALAPVVPVVPVAPVVLACAPATEPHSAPTRHPTTAINATFDRNIRASLIAEGDSWGTYVGAVDPSQRESRDNQPMDLGIGGRVALVLGASKGIGRATATELAAEGARVAVASRGQGPLAELAVEIGATAFEHDNENLAAAPALVDAVTAALGPIEILVINGGGPPTGNDPLAFTPQQWDLAHRTLLRAPLAMIDAVLPGMRERGYGRIVNVGSATTREPAPPLMLSNAERAAALGAFKTISTYVAKDGVTLNTVLPGRIATDRVYEIFGREGAERIGREEVPIGRLGMPEELAAAIVFLCSERASYITGVALLVDGGFSRLV
jgi:3-oxoacyl-[acyl-carrier protein] reductase